MLLCIKFILIKEVQFDSLQFYYTSKTLSLTISISNIDSTEARHIVHINANYSNILGYGLSSNSINRIYFMQDIIYDYIIEQGQCLIIFNVTINIVINSLFMMKILYKL